MNNVKRFCGIICNPFIWIYFISITIIFLLSLDILSFKNIILLYFIIFFTGIVAILGICTSPKCSYDSLLNRVKKKNKD